MYVTIPVEQIAGIELHVSRCRETLGQAVSAARKKRPEVPQLHHRIREEGGRENA